MSQAMFRVEVYEAAAVAVDVAAPARRSRYSGPEFEEGRHRRVYPELVVHLVFDDQSELSLGPDNPVGRSLGHLAGWLVER
jgi:hypothetical protein